MLEISKLKKDLSKILYNNKPIRVLFKNHLSSTNDFLSNFLILKTEQQRASPRANDIVVDVVGMVLSLSASE